MKEELIAFNSIMRKCLNSKYLLSYGIKKSPSFQEFKEKVSIITYSELEPFIDRAYNGEKNIFSKEPIIIWGMTSGTTGKPKLIPHTKSSLKVYQKKMNSFFVKLILNNPSIIKGKILLLTGRSCNWKTSQSMCVGSISGIMASKIPSLFSKRVLYNPKELDKIPDSERFGYIAKRALKENVSMIASSSATYLLGLFQELEKLSKKKIIDIWPNLKVISCPCGGHYKEQIDDISKILPNVKIIDTGLGATEGYFFISEQGREAIGTPCRKDYLIELLDTQTKRVFSIDEAELNKKYELIISTINGILRYRMGDFVQVIQKKNRRLLRFISKKIQEVSIFGERITQAQLNDAFSSLNKKNNLDKENFLFIAPSKDKRFNRYYLIIPSKYTTKLLNIQEEIENQLQEKNINYKNIRTMTKLLNPLKVIFVSKGDFNKILVKVYKSNFSGQGRKKEIYFPEKDDFYEFLLSKSIK